MLSMQISFSPQNPIVHSKIADEVISIGNLVTRKNIAYHQDEYLIYDAFWLREHAVVEGFIDFSDAPQASLWRQLSANPLLIPAKKFCETRETERVPVLAKKASISIVP